MAYAIRTKGKHLTVRDPSHPVTPLPSDPVYEVGPEKWVGFEHLPIGASESGDTDLEVEAVELVDGEWPEWVTRPESVQARKARLAAEAAAVSPPPPPPEPVVRTRRKAKLSDASRVQPKDDDGDE